MALRRPVACLLLLAVAVPPAGAGEPKRPVLELRASPRVAVVPGNVLLTAELRGGQDGEALHCLTAAWDWGDGSTSEETADCEPWAPGTEVQRRFSADREFRRESRPTVTLRLLKDGREVARSSVRLILQEKGKNGLQLRTRPEREGTAPSGTP